jgi:hypothetical protein
MSQNPYQNLSSIAGRKVTERITRSLKTWKVSSSMDAANGALLLKAYLITP